MTPGCFPSRSPGWGRGTPDEEDSPRGDLEHLGVPLKDGELLREPDEERVDYPDLRQVHIVSPDLPLEAPRNLCAETPREHLPPAADPEGGLPALHDLP